jgi:prepilin-type N-terminal cleavage/methylation domain-containing protein
MTKKSRAFSLIELSIVILIIGILIAGVTQSSRLLRMAKLSTAQTLTKSSPVAGIKGLVLWVEPTLDESFLASQSDDGVVVDQWNDINPQSSQKYFLVDTYNHGILYQASAGPNGLPSLYFNGDSQEFDLSNSNYQSEICCNGLPSNDTTLFVVYMTTTAEDSYMEIFNLGSGRWNYDLDGIREFYTTGGTVHNFTDTSSSTFPSSSVPEIVSTTLDKSTINMYVNGVNHRSASAVSPIDADGDFWIYGNNLNVSEIIVFDRALKTEERQSIESYLGKKYGIKVSASTAGSAT